MENQSTNPSHRLMLEGNLFDKISKMTDHQFVIIDMHVSLVELLREDAPTEAEISGFISGKIIDLITQTTALMNIDMSGQAFVEGKLLLRPAQECAAHASLLSEQLIKAVRLEDHPFFKKGKTKAGFKENVYNEANPEPQPKSNRL